MNQSPSIIGEYKKLKYLIHTNLAAQTYLGYVRLPDEHPYQPLVDKTETVDFAMEMWRLTKEMAESLNKKFDIPKPKSRPEEIHMGYNDMDINCHGGLTFCRRVTEKDTHEWPQGFLPGAWIGWDYGHVGDFINMVSAAGSDDKKWTLAEVEEECKNVINQLLKIKKVKKNER